MQMNNPLVCVVMPVYNGAKTIELALKSLLMQTYLNWECVIVNDGSTDGTKSILDSLSDRRFKVIHLEKNIGRGAARQVCLDNSEGKYLAYLDADDFYHRDKLKMQVDFLEMNPQIDLLGCGLLAFDKNDEPLSVRGKRKITSCFFRERNKLPIAMATAMIKSAKGKSVRYNAKLNAGEDEDYLSRYLDGGYYANLDVVLWYCYIGSTSYIKILKYSFSGLQRGLFLFNRNPLAGLKMFFLSAIKILIYAIIIPFTGVNFFLKRRGSKVSRKEADEYHKELLLYKDN